MKSTDHKRINNGFRGRILSSVILILMFLHNHPCAYSQYSVISSGTLVAGNGGSITVNTNLIDGSGKESVPGNILLKRYAVNLGTSSSPVTADLKGIVNNGDLELILYNYNNTNTEGFNNFGNRYPSPIDRDASAGWNKDNIDDDAYYFIASPTARHGGAYSRYSNGISSDGMAPNILLSMRGFFLHVSDSIRPVTVALGMTNNVRVNDVLHSFLKAGNTNTPAYLRLAAGYADDSLSFDPLCVYFDSSATYNFDSHYDAYKLFNTDMNVTNFYSFGNDSSKLSINALPLNDSSICIVRLGLKTERSGNVIFIIKDIIGAFRYNYVSINDVITGTMQDMTNNQQYKVNLAAGDYQNRFFLNLSYLKSSIPIIDSDKEWFNIYSSQGILKTEINLAKCENGILRIYNLLGQNLFVYYIHQAGYHEFRPALNDGIYIITFDSGKYRFVRKVFVQGK